jgi:hypothetical protein
MRNELQGGAKIPVDAIEIMPYPAIPIGANGGVDATDVVPRDDGQRWFEHPGPGAIIEYPETGAKGKMDAGNLMPPGGKGHFLG